MLDMQILISLQSLKKRQECGPGRNRGTREDIAAKSLKGVRLSISLFHVAYSTDFLESSANFRNVNKGDFGIHRRKGNWIDIKKTPQKQNRDGISRDPNTSYYDVSFNSLKLSL